MHALPGALAILLSLPGDCLSLTEEAKTNRDSQFHVVGDHLSRRAHSRGTKYAFRGGTYGLNFQNSMLVLALFAGPRLSPHSSLQVRRSIQASKLLTLEIAAIRILSDPGFRRSWFSLMNSGFSRSLGKYQHTHFGLSRARGIEKYTLRPIKSKESKNRIGPVIPWRTKQKSHPCGWLFCSWPVTGPPNLPGREAPQVKPRSGPGRSLWNLALLTESIALPAHYAFLRVACCPT